MSKQSIADTLHAFYACFQYEDYIVRVIAFFGPDVVWHVAGDNPLAGEFRGVDAVLAQMLRYEEHSQGTLRLDTSIAATDSHAVAIHVATASRPGIDYRAHEIDVFHVSGSRITEFWSFSEDQDATDRIWS